MIITPEQLEDLEIAIGNELLLIPSGTPWEDKADRLAKAALATLGITVADDSQQERG